MSERSSLTEALGQEGGATSEPATKRPLAFVSIPSKVSLCVSFEIFTGGTGRSIVVGYVSFYAMSLLLSTAAAAGSISALSLSLSRSRYAFSGDWCRGLPLTLFVRCSQLLFFLSNKLRLLRRSG